MLQKALLDMLTLYRTQIRVKPSDQSDHGTTVENLLKHMTQRQHFFESVVKKADSQDINI